MDKKASSKHSLNLKFKHSKRKTTKNSARTPNHLESIFDQKSIHLSKFKTIHSKPDREAIRSLMPPSTNLFTDEPEHPRKIYKTNQTEVDLPHSQSEKTITMSRPSDKPKDNTKTQKTSKKCQPKKSSKIEMDLFESTHQFLTTRKSSLKKANLKNILMRTEKLLESYQKREEEWLRERETLVEQVDQMRRKDSTKKCVTSSSSAYITKKHLY